MESIDYEIVAIDLKNCFEDVELESKMLDITTTCTYSHFDLYIECNLSVPFSSLTFQSLSIDRVNKIDGVSVTWCMAHFGATPRWLPGKIKMLLEKCLVMWIDWRPLLVFQYFCNAKHYWVMASVEVLLASSCSSQLKVRYDYHTIYCIYGCVCATE